MWPFPFWFSHNVPELAQFETPSNSTPGVWYTLTVDKHGHDGKAAWEISCNCFGANRWKKHGNLMHPETSDPCIHIRGLLIAFAYLFEEE